MVFSGRDVHILAAGEKEILKFEGKQSNEETPIEVKRTADASDDYEDVTLRLNNTNRYFARPLAISSDFINLTDDRESESKIINNTDTRKAYCNIQKKRRSKTFNANTKNSSDSPTFMHFQEPLNIEGISDIIVDSRKQDLQWHDLNIVKMSEFESKSAINQTKSPNTSLSHNLSLSCQEQELYKSIKSNLNEYHFMKPIRQNYAEQSQLLVEKIEEKIREFNKLASLEALLESRSMEFGGEIDHLITQCRSTLSTSSKSSTHSLATSDFNEEIEADPFRAILSNKSSTRSVKHAGQKIRGFNSFESLESGSSGFGSESDDVISHCQKTFSSSSCSLSSSNSLTTSDFNEKISTVTSSASMRLTNLSKAQITHIQTKKLLETFSAGQAQTKIATANNTNESCLRDMNLHQKTNKRFIKMSIEKGIATKLQRKSLSKAAEKISNIAKRRSVFKHMKNTFLSLF